MNRFKKRRQGLRARLMCTRCGTSKAKPDCTHCGDCLAVMSAKRETDPAATARRSARLRRRRQLLSDAWERLKQLDAA